MSFLTPNNLFQRVNKFSIRLPVTNFHPYKFMTLITKQHFHIEEQVNGCEFTDSLSPNELVTNQRITRSMTSKSSEQLLPKNDVKVVTTKSKKYNNKNSKKSKKVISLKKSKIVKKVNCNKGIYCPHDKRWALCIECSPSSAIAHNNRCSNNYYLRKGITSEEQEIIQTIFESVLKRYNKSHLRRRVIPNDVWEEIEPDLFSELSRKLPKYQGKKTKYHRNVGCDPRFFVFNIIRQLKPGMELGENRKEIWDLDHIRACASFDLTKLSDRKKEKLNY
jgi:hypothetical protein